MSIAEQLLAEFEPEARTTRKFLERLPADKLEWKPHPKSMSAGQLAFHIAESPGNVVQLAEAGEFNAPEMRRENTQPANLQEILQKFDESVATVKKILPTFTDESMQSPWKLKIGGKEALVMPRAVFLRNILFNHTYHHRGQFGVYLRLAGAQVPSTYGPSGDELPEFLQNARKTG
jgi:uncharacterized damage-inducible protein DinB